MLQALCSAACNVSTRRQIHQLVKGYKPAHYCRKWIIVIVISVNNLTTNLRWHLTLHVKISNLVLRHSATNT